MFSGRGVLALASALPELPVIIITAFGGPEVEAQTLQPRCLRLSGEAGCCRPIG